MDKVRRKNTANPKKVENATTCQKEYTYEPGRDCKLTWSDGFEADCIVKNNWNFQLVEAGHFDDEWQRYTNHGK